MLWFPPISLVAERRTINIKPVLPKDTKTITIMLLSTTNKRENDEDRVAAQLDMQEIFWNVVPSEFSMLMMNPIRKIVDNIKKPSHSNKELIPLSLGNDEEHDDDDVSSSNTLFLLGDPTVFGNLTCPKVMVDAVVTNVQSIESNVFIITFI